MARAGAPKARPKTLLERRRELSSSAAILKDALERFREGDQKQGVVLSGQLRALLNSHGNKPLLLSMAEKLDFALPCFGLCVDSESIRAVPLIDGQRTMSSLPINSFVSIRSNGLCAGGETTFGTWIDTKFFSDTSHPKKYSFGEMIFAHANNRGGAHYSDTISIFEQFLSCMPFTGSPWRTLFDMLLADAASVTIHFAGHLCAECDRRAYALLEEKLR